MQGWSALLSGCLALFYSSQHQVIGTNLEETLKHFKKPVKLKEICKLMKKFEINTEVLNELENLFYFSFDEYS